MWLTIGNKRRPFHRWSDKKIVPLFLFPWGRGRGPTRKCWEGEGEQVLQLNHLIPLILPSFAWAPPSLRWGEGKPPLNNLILVKQRLLHQVGFFHPRHMEQGVAAIDDGKIGAPDDGAVIFGNHLNAQIAKRV